MCHCLCQCSKTLEINVEILQQLPGEDQSYASVDSAVCESEGEATHYPHEFIIYSLKPSGMPPHILNLKVGHAITELKHQSSLCNQTCLMTKKRHLNVIDAEVILGKQQSKRVLIPKVVLTASDLDHSFVLCCRQFIAWAMTVNKSQK